jgi:hypothetical protein
MCRRPSGVGSLHLDMTFFTPFYFFSRMFFTMGTILGELIDPWSPFNRRITEFSCQARSCVIQTDRNRSTSLDHYKDIPKPLQHCEYPDGFLDARSPLPLVTCSMCWGCRCDMEGQLGGFGTRSSTYTGNSMRSTICSIPSIQLKE